MGVSLQAGARRARPRLVAHRAAPRKRLRMHGRAEAAGLPAARTGGRRGPVIGAGHLAGARRRRRRGRGLHAAAGDCEHIVLKICIGSPGVLAVSQCPQQRTARTNLALYLTAVGDKPRRPGHGGPAGARTGRDRRARTRLRSSSAAASRAARSTAASVLSRTSLRAAGLRVG